LKFKKITRHKLKADTLNVTSLLGKLVQIILFTGETTALTITNEVARAIVDNMFEEEVTSLLPRTSNATNDALQHAFFICGIGRVSCTNQVSF